MSEGQSRRLAAHTAMIALVGCAMVLWRYPEARFYPACPVFRLLGVRCPGCGATRALAALLHGRFVEALRWNALFVVALPWLMAYAGVAYRRMVVETEFRWPRVAPVATFGCVAAAAAFAVGRDLLGF